MNLPMRFRGLPVSEGITLGTLHIADDQTAVSATPEEVRDAFAAVAAERFALAERLRAVGREQEAAIIEVGGLMAADPLLADPAVAAVRAGGDAATAVRQAAETQAAVLEALPNREMAERAGDVRQVAHAVLDSARPGRRRAAAARRLHPGPPRGEPGRPDRAGRGRTGGRGLGGAAARARTRRSSRAGSACR